MAERPSFPANAPVPPAENQEKEKCRPVAGSVPAMWVSQSPSAPGVEPLPAGDVVSNLLPHAYWASMADGARKERMVRAYLALAGTIDVYRVTMPESLDDLPWLLDEIEERVLARVGAR